MQIFYPGWGYKAPSSIQESQHQRSSMPPKRATKGSYHRYLVDVPPSSHSETIYVDDDSHTRETHASAAPPIISAPPEPLLPSVTATVATATPPSRSFERDSWSSEINPNVIEALDEPSPADEPELIDEVHIYSHCFCGAVDI